MDPRNRQILKQLTLGRVWNYFLLKSSYVVTNLTKKPIHWGSPIAVSIEPTTACNLKCPQCPSGLKQFTRPTGNLKPSVNQNILDGLGKNLQYINYYFQGEPFINPLFLDLVKEASNRNIYVLTSTNAHFISEKAAEKVVQSGMSEVIISIDGITQETYQNYRIEGKLDKVLEGTKNLVAARKKLKSKLPIITFQFLVSKQNEHEIEEAKALSNKLGVDRINFKTIQIYDYESGNELIPENPDYSRYKKTKTGEYILKNKYKNSCWRMWSSCVFTWDGTVVPCCFDKDAKYNMGNISQKSFNKIWKADVYQQFRNQVWKDRTKIDICKNCSEGSKIWI
ncbi:SPASM domain-containing protein [Paracrocinitomix mangrovi]|uniref:radical SAM/SPASM domain-containing protein n=1 Tax=Paracrocinitomix mangrovi TaxID=2862509 RepID=UPI001C8D5442|nr:radical SAM/SPASM domain-containing protein [Paracrocinitomix mangrovi]UKN01135.1 SPASM domain-containing protein [Paracrocinitomix mangrovi]